jgi:hypothetical protein
MGWKKDRLRQDKKKKKKKKTSFSVEPRPAAVCEMEGMI